MQPRLLAVALGMLALFANMPDAAACDLRFPHCAEPAAQGRAVSRYAPARTRVVRQPASQTIARRPAGCPRTWCGCWLARHLGLHDRKLWLARNWTRVGRPAAGPAPGVVAVYARGRGGGHVGIIKRVVDRNTVVLLSGNDDGAVRERERSTAGVIAYRVP